MSAFSDQRIRLPLQPGLVWVGFQLIVNAAEAWLADILDEPDVLCREFGCAWPPAVTSVPRVCCSLVLTASAELTMELESCPGDVAAIEMGGNVTNRHSKAKVLGQDGLGTVNRKDLRRCVRKMK